MTLELTKFKQTFLIILVFFSFLNTSIAKEANFNENIASFVISQKDTLLNKYNEIENLFSKEEYSTALEKGLILIDESLKEKRDYINIKANYIVAQIFSKTRNHNKAIGFYRKTLRLIDGKLKTTIKDKLSSVENSELEFIRNEATLKLGGAYHRLEVQYEAKKNKVSLIFKDSAKYFYNRIIDLPDLNENVSRLKAKVYSNLAGMLSRDSSYIKAKEYALKAIAIHKKQNDVMSEAAALSNLANIYLHESKYDVAKDLYLRGLGLIKFNDSNLANQFKESLYENIGYAMYMLKDYKAYDYQEKSYEIKDKLRDKEIRRIIEEIDKTHKIEVAKQQAREAKSKVELKKLQDRKTALFFGIMSLLVVIISGVILYNYKLRQRNLKLKFDQNELIQQKNIEKLKSDSQIKILNATLDGKESERKQIAETLHDSVSTLLSSANLHLQATRTQFNGKTPVEIEKTQAIITEASQKIRDLSHTLVSSILLKFGLRYAIKDMAEKYSNSAIQIHADFKNIRRYHQSFEIKANNIIQEFVNNILKHSNAKNAYVSLEDEDGKLNISINDDGDGFEVNDITQKDGLGINQIDARIQVMKGTFTIDSKKDQGTKIFVMLPILEKEKTNLV